MSGEVSGRARARAKRSAERNYSRFGSGSCLEDHLTPERLVTEKGYYGQAYVLS